jgi:2,3-bisphosphoglycerate-dependent phosphoglycerate mutase
MPTLVLLRHGQSVWNLEKRFTGWVDIDLTAKGEDEAARAGAQIKAEGLAFDRVHASVLTRAIRTADLALAAAGQLWIPMVKDWRLNERHYGALTGQEHAPVEARYGAEQVRLWRRSYDIPPPPLEPGGPLDFSADRRYAGIEPPRAESLKMTLERVLPYWQAKIAPELAAGETLLVAAHGNSLRAIVKHLFDVADADIPKVEIPTGNPLLVELGAKLSPRSARYLDAAAAAPLPPLPAGGA